MKEADRGCAGLVWGSFFQRVEGRKVEKGSGVLWEWGCAGLVWSAFFQRFEGWKVEKGSGGFVGAGLCVSCLECVFFNGLRVGKLKKGVGVCGSGAVRGLVHLAVGV